MHCMRRVRQRSPRADRETRTATLGLQSAVEEAGHEETGNQAKNRTRFTFGSATFPKTQFKFHKMADDEGAAVQPGLRTAAREPDPEEEMMPIDEDL